VEVGLDQRVLPGRLGAQVEELERRGELADRAFADGLRTPLEPRYLRRPDAEEAVR